MANEDEKIVADYMGWTEISVEDPMNRGVFEYILLKHNNCEAHFDLNDAGLVVKEMQERYEWDEFMHYCWKYFPLGKDYIGRLFNADNFFSAFVAWRKTK